MPGTAAAIATWDGRDTPGEEAYQALAKDLAEARAQRSLGIAAKRLNLEITGFRSLLLKTARKLPEQEPASYRTALISIDPAWGEPGTWAAIRRAVPTVTPFYLLAALDLRIDDVGRFAAMPPDRAIFVDVFIRTLWMGLVVTVVCLLLGFPAAYLLATLPVRVSNILMIMVLLPFWTSLLVRTAAWIIVLQREGPINELLRWTGVIEEPLQLVFNRTGVYVAMTHILLPFMILPLYSVMKSISPAYMRAAASLGAKPPKAFLRVYLPQTVPGIGAGSLLVFILAIGYYITPALVGGPKDQMASYFIAFFTNNTINWGMASALGAVLLTATLLLYGVYSRLVGIDKMRLG
jgi:putative spermidine/putrescine transport system permease protein